MKLFRLRAAHIRLGNLGERAAVALLKAKNMRVIARNYRVPAGELDLVALDGLTLVFVEVKTRSRRDRFGLSAGLSLHQMRRNVRAGRYFLRATGDAAIPYRYDLIEVLHDFRCVRAIYHHHHYYGTDTVRPRNGKE